MNINVYIYAPLQFHHKESPFSSKSGQEPRIGFEVTIELNGMAIDAKKKIRASELLYSGKHWEDVVEKFGSTSQVTRDNLDTKTEVKSPPADPPVRLKLTCLKCNDSFVFLFLLFLELPLG
jgi:hypothetical protein